MLGKGYLDNRDLGKFHRFSFGVELGEGVLFLLKVKFSMVHFQSIYLSYLLAFHDNPLCKTHKNLETAMED